MCVCGFAGESGHKVAQLLPLFFILSEDGCLRGSQVLLGSVPGERGLPLATPAMTG